MSEEKELKEKELKKVNGGGMPTVGYEWNNLGDNLTGQVQGWQTVNESDESKDKD